MQRFLEALRRHRGRALCRRYRGYGRGRASGRPHLPRGRRRSRVGVEAELLFANRDHVGPGEEALPLDPRVIHRRAVRARVNDQVSLGSLYDLGVAARHVLARHDDVAGRIAPEDERRTSDCVLAAVRQRDDATARVGGGLPSLCLGLRLRHRLRKAHRLHVLRAATATLIDERQLLSRDFDLVAVEQRSRLRSQAHAIDQDFRFWNCLGDYDLTVGETFELGVARQDTGTGQRNGAVGICAEQHFTLRECELPPAEFKQRHARTLPSPWPGGEVTRACVSGQGTRS